jgi:thiol:disulfide interchange protein DsbC
MFKKALVASLVLTVLSASAMAAAADPSVLALQSAFDQVKASMAEQLKLKPQFIKLQPALTKVLRETTSMDDHYVFNYNTQRLIVDSTGGYLITDTSKIYLPNKNMPLTGVFANHLFSLPENKKWVTSELPDGVKKTADLYFVTDPTCGYCVQVDKEKDVYAKAGIQLHYIPYPRAGVDLDPTKLARNTGLQKWAQAMCATNPAQAYHEIALSTDEGKYKKTMSEITPECFDKVIRGFEFGQELGVTGTPYMYGISVTGDTVNNPGYKPASEIANGLGVFIKNESKSKF